MPYNEVSQKLLLPQTTDMSRKDNLKLLYNSLPEGMCDNQYESLEQDVNDIETFNYSHETSTKHVLVQGVYVGSASPLIADIKTQPYSMLTYLDDGMMTGTYDNTHDIPIYIDNGSTLNIMPTHFMTMHTICIIYQRRQRQPRLYIPVTVWSKCTFG